MKVNFSTPLVNKITGKCGYCEETKALEHLVVDEEERMYSICADCMNYLMGEETG